MSVLDRLLREPPAYAGIAPGEEVLPGYRVVRLLTHGRRLDTYDAYDEDRGCRAVVKILRPDRLDDERVRAAVLQEGEIVTGLAHPHLVRGYARSVEPPALVIETLSGATLAAVVEQGPLGHADAALLGLQLASVLGYLHRHDWLHLDVKPANVVVRGGAAVLIDLSLASQAGEGRPGAGTRGYLAPEQALGQGLTPATDVWGLGVTLLEVLTGELAYGDEATWESRRRLPLVHRRLPGRPFGRPGSPSAAVLAELPDGWAELLLACVAVDPAARPRLADVRAILEQDSADVSHACCSACMSSVSVRELRNRGGDVLDRVARGESVIVTATAPRSPSFGRWCVRALPPPIWSHAGAASRVWIRCDCTGTSTR